jgi:translation initiation factor 2A
LIVLAQTDVDKTNKSYYGDSTMYLLSVNGAFDARIQLDKEGPIHDVTWSPSGKEFGVIYGYMPSKTTIFNQRAVALHTFELKPRNTIYFSPNSRFVLVAGFGNLAGSIDIYDQEKDYRKICTIESGTPSVCDFSPDSRYILLATTSPRLRVDNGVKIWHVGGTLIYDEDFEELYNVQWRPIFPENVQAGDPLNPVPTPHASGLAYLGRQKTPSKPVGAYRPPGARGMAAPLHFRREDEGGAAHVMSNGSSGLGGGNLFGRPRRAVPGAEFADPGARGVPGAAPTEVPGANGDENLSKTALKNKKKRNNKKKEGGEGQNNGGGLAPPAGEQVPGSGNEGRSRDRRHGQHPQQGQGYHNSRSRSRNPHNSRSRANTYRNGDGQPRGGHNQNHQNATPAPVIVAPAAPAIIESPLSPGSQNPGAKKIRSLQKKIRAIEDLEMRLAGGEKLEDTQIKKIATKQSVARELETLEREGH